MTTNPQNIDTATASVDSVNTSRLAEIRERAEKATSGPWFNEELTAETAEIIYHPAPDTYERIAIVEGVPSYRDPDAEFIAHAREDVPFLIAEIASLRSRLEAAERDSKRLDWAIRRSAMLFRRETPEPMIMIAFFPQQQDGFIAKEYEGRDVQIQTPTARLSEFDGDVNKAYRHLIDTAMTSMSAPPEETA